jgi:flagellar basal body-associated protein FliL
MADKSESKQESTQEVSADQAQPSTKSKVAAWLPLMLAVIIMPLSAYLMTKFYLVKQLDTKIQEATSTQVDASDSADPSESASQQAEGGEDHGTHETATDHAGESSGSAHSGTESASGSSDNSAAAVIAYQIESMVVNVRQTGASRFLIASISVDCQEQSQRQKLKDILSIKDPFLRDAAQRVLSNFTLEELEDEPAAKRKAEAALIVEFRDFLRDTNIEFSVLFTQWTVQ